LIKFIFFKNRDGVLFKKAGVFLNKSQLSEAKDMEIFIGRRVNELE